MKIIPIQLTIVNQTFHCSAAEWFIWDQWGKFAGGDLEIFLRLKTNSLQNGSSKSIFPRLFHPKRQYGARFEILSAPLRFIITFRGENWCSLIWVHFLPRPPPGSSYFFLFLFSYFYFTLGSVFLLCFSCWRNEIGEDMIYFCFALKPMATLKCYLSFAL